MSNAKLPDIQTLVQAGINPKKGKSGLKWEDGSISLKDSIKKQLRILDEQNAVNMFTWYNLPVGLSGQELERLLYYKGQLAFFYLEELNQFYMLPYALAGTIDAYGRYNTIHPVPIASGSKDKAVLEQEKTLADYLSTKKFDVLYDVVLPEELIEKPEYYMNNCCVLLHDYTKQLSEIIIPRQQLQEPLLDIMSNCIPFMNTALQNSTGITGVKVNSEDESYQVQLASKSTQVAALTGEKWIPIQGGLNFQDLVTSTITKPEEFLLAMQGLDNYRLSLHGLENGGLFQKKAHMLEAEQEMNAGNLSLILSDKYNIRTRFTNIVNSVWGLGTAILPAEEIINADLNGDGIVASGAEQSYESESTGGTESNETE